MNAAVGQKAYKVQSSAAPLDVFHGAKKSGIFKKLSVLYSLVDFSNILINDSARAEIEMPHLAVAHLPRGKPYRSAAGLDKGMRILFHKAGNIRDTACLYRVALIGISPAEAVHYYYRVRFFHNRHSVNIRGRSRNG